MVGGGSRKALHYEALFVAALPVAAGPVLGLLGHRRRNCCRR